MLSIFYSDGTFKKRKMIKVSTPFYGASYQEFWLWTGEFEPEPSPSFKSHKEKVWIDEASKQNTFTHKLPDKFKPKPAYKGAP